MALFIARNAGSDGALSRGKERKHATNRATRPIRDPDEAYVRAIHNMRGRLGAMLISAYSLGISDEDTAIAHLAFFLYDDFTQARARASASSSDAACAAGASIDGSRSHESSSSMPTSSQGSELRHACLGVSSPCLTRSPSEHGACAAAAPDTSSNRTLLMQAAAPSPLLSALVRPPPAGIGAAANASPRVLEPSDNAGSWRRGKDRSRRLQPYSRPSPDPPSAYAPPPRADRCRCPAGVFCPRAAEDGYNGCCSICYATSCACRCAHLCDCSPSDLCLPSNSPSPLMLPEPASPAVRKPTEVQLRLDPVQAVTRALEAAHEARDRQRHGKRRVYMAPRGGGSSRRSGEVIQRFGPSYGADKPELFDDDLTYVAEVPGKDTGLFSARGFEAGSAVAAMIDPKRMDEDRWLNHCEKLRLPTDSMVCRQHSHLGFYDAAFPAGPILVHWEDRNSYARLTSSHLAPKWYRINYSSSPNLRIRLAGQGRAAPEQAIYWEAIRRIEPHEELTCDMYLHVPTEWTPQPARLEPSALRMGRARPPPHLYPKLAYIRSYRRRELVGWGHGRRSDYESHSSRASSDGEDFGESSPSAHPLYWLCDASDLGDSDSRAGAPPAPSAVR